jgi:hypothetical protein
MEAKEIDHGELFTSTGILRYSHNDEYGYRLVMDVDRDLANYYRGLIPKWIKTGPKPKEDMVVEPLAKTASSCCPVEEATTKGLMFPPRPTTVRVLAGVVVFIPIYPPCVTLK